MKKIFYLLLLLFTINEIHAQQGIGVTNPSASAAWEINSTTKGILLPRMTTAQMTAISLPAAGLMVYNTDLQCIHYYNLGWKSQCDPANLGAWSLLGNTGTSAATNFIGTKDNVGLRFRTDDTERMTIMNTGYVGVGTTSPSALFEVSSNNSGSGNDIALTGYHNSDPPVFTIRRGRGTRAAPANLNTNDISGGLHFYGYVNNSFSIPITSIESKYNGDGTTLLGSLLFATSGSTKMTLDQNGNLGIGASTPTNQLHVNAASNPARLEGLQTGATTDDVITADATGVLKKQTAASLIGNNAWALDGNNVTAIKKLGTTSNFDLPIITNNTEKMRVTTTGFVGIGTSAPVELLDIRGTAATAYDADFDLTSYGANTSTLHIRKAGGTDIAPTLYAGGGITSFEGEVYDGTAYRKAAMVGIATDGTTGAGDIPGRLDFYTTPDGSTSPAQRMTIKNDGNVGVSTATPNSTFHVAGSIATAIRLINTDYTVDATDYTLVVEPTAPMTLTLPTPASCAGRTYIIKKMNTVNAVTFSSALYLDSVNTLATTTMATTLSIQSDGTRWLIVNRF